MDWVARFHPDFKRRMKRGPKPTTPIYPGSAPMRFPTPDLKVIPLTKTDIAGILDGIDDEIDILKSAKEVLLRLQEKIKGG